MPARWFPVAVSRHRLLGALVAVSLFCTVFFAKAWVVDRHGTDLPNWDQWDAEGLALLLPWSRGELKVADLFAPHNEHRVALTRVLALGLVVVNGQWDGRLQMLVNGALHSLLAVGLWFWLRPLLRPWQQAAWALALVATIAPPHAWQNALGAFHSQQYLLLALSLFGIDRVLRHRPPEPGWFLGITALGLSLFTMASGPAAAAVVFGLLAVGVVRSPREALRRDGLTLLACAGILAAGIALHVDYPGHAPLRANSVDSFVRTLWRALQWPVKDLVAFGALSYLPWALLAWRVLTRPSDVSDPSAGRERVIVAAGAWVLLQFLAAAYARGAAGDWPASRYFDTHTLGLLANLAAFALLPRPTAVWPARLRLAFFALWIGAVAHGLDAHLRQVFTAELPVVADWFRKSETHTRLYLGTGDPVWLKDGEVPYPNPEHLRHRIDHPELRALLPASVSPALPVTPADAVKFVPGGVPAAVPALVSAPTWGSWTADEGAAAMGQWISEPIVSAFGRLKFETAGRPGTEKMRLELWSADLSRFLRSVSPSRSPGDTWRAAYVRTPREPFRIVAADADPAGWFAFSGPIPMASGSYVAWRIAAHAQLGTWISGGILLAVLAALLLPPRQTVPGAAAAAP
jgi:hypothetical protein